MGKRTREVAEKKCVDIWTDGSHIKGTPKMGFGVYVEADGRKGEISVEMTPRSLNGMLVVPTALAEGSADPSNPTLELVAALVAVRRVRKFAADIERVTLHADYLGVVNYANGVWDARRAGKKTPAFAAAARAWQSEVAALRKEVAVDVIWVRGHSGNPGNDRADRLARAGADCDTFDDVFK